MRDAEFTIAEQYFDGMHISTESDRDDLEGVMTQVLASGGVDAYSVQMVEDSSDGFAVSWRVHVVVLETQFAALQAHVASPYFETILVGGVHHLGGTHTKSVFATPSSVTAAGPYTGVAPSPPSS